MRRLVATLRGIAAYDPFIAFLGVASVIFLLYWAVTVQRETI